MGDFLYGQCLKGAGRRENAINLKFSLLDPSLLSFKASSLRSPPPPFHLAFNLFIDTEVILSYVMV